MIYKLEKVCKSFSRGGRDLSILKDLDLSVPKGGFLCVSGASGAGKSTLLHIMGALDRPTSGSVLFQGRELPSLSSSKSAFLRREKIGFVFQFHYLLNEFTALENIALPALIAAVPRKKAFSRAEFLIETVGVSHRKSHFPSEMSGGEQQRVAVARALVNQPEVLLADEPAGNLDRASARKIQDLLFDLHERFQLTIVAVSHNLSFARSCPSRAEIEDGKIKSLSPPAHPVA